MKRLGLEIPEYDRNIDPTKNLVDESSIEWNILKKHIMEVKQRYDKILKDYKKRKADEKLKNGTIKMPKIKKWKSEEKVEDILQLSSEIMKEKITENVDLTLDEENDDIFVE